MAGPRVVALEQALAAARLADAGARAIEGERDEGGFARGYGCAAAGASCDFGREVFGERGPCP